MRHLTLMISAATALLAPVLGAPARAAERPDPLAAIEGSRQADYAQWRPGWHGGPRYGYGAGYGAGPRYGYGPGYGYGPRYGGYYGRPYYRRDYGGAAAAGVLGLATGAIIGGAIASQQAAPVYAAPSGNAAYCAQRYRSYNPATGTYRGYDGYDHPCP
jgi:hypothetical protein